MRLFQQLPNTPHNDLRVYCFACNRIEPLSRAVCDLDGHAFRAYYCGLCAIDAWFNHLENKQ